MALTETTTIDQIEVSAAGHIQVRWANRVFRDGVEISKTYQRDGVLAPGSDLAGKDPRIVAIAQAAWTPEVIAAYQASIAQQ